MTENINVLVTGMITVKLRARHGGWLEFEGLGGERLSRLRGEGSHSAADAERVLLVPLKDVTYVAWERGIAAIECRVFSRPGFAPEQMRINVAIDRTAFDRLTSLLGGEAVNLASEKPEPRKPRATRKSQ